MTIEPVRPFGYFCAATGPRVLGKELVVINVEVVDAEFPFATNLRYKGQRRRLLACDSLRWNH